MDFPFSAPPGMMPPPRAPAMPPHVPQPAGGLTDEMLQEKSRKYVESENFSIALV